MWNKLIFTWARVKENMCFPLRCVWRDNNSTHIAVVVCVFFFHSLRVEHVKFHAHHA